MLINTTKRWSDGYYSFSFESSFIYEVKGETVFIRNLCELDFPEELSPAAIGTWKYGDFGQAPPTIQAKTGMEHYNIEMKGLFGMVQLGVVSKDGTKVTKIGFTGQVDQGHLLSTQKLQEKLNSREPMETPQTSYKIQPENQGKLIWLSGPPGAGKSTSGLLLAKNNGYVYYEADCFMQTVNPFMPLDSKEPSLEQMFQKPLKGKSLSTVKACTEFFNELGKMVGGKHPDEDITRAFYKEMSLDVLAQKRRIGGTWTVAMAVTNKKMRDAIRDILGNEVIFVTLTLTEAGIRKRCEGRHNGNEEIVQGQMRISQMFEPIEKDEMNAINIDIMPEMSKIDVVETILEKVKPFL